MRGFDVPTAKVQHVVALILEKDQRVLIGRDIEVPQIRL